MAPQAEFKLWEEASDEWQELSPIACRQPRRRNPCRPFPGSGWVQGESCFGVGRVQNTTRYEVLGREAKRSSLLEETDREREKGLEF
jgi:hypothetical protein